MSSRVIAAAPSLLLLELVVVLTGGCATGTGVTRMDIQELRAELRAERQHSADLETRLARLEDQKLARTVGAAHALAGEGTGGSRNPDEDAMPSLEVVKLKPRRDPPPPLDTHTLVAEPARDFADDLAAPPVPAAGLDVTALRDTPQEDPAILDVKYDDAVAALRTGNVEGAVGTLEQFAAAHPKHPKADNALYFAAVGKMGLEDYAGAVRELQGLIAHYPAGDAVQSAMLKLAECRVRQRNPSEARSLYARILASYPGTPAATQAQQQLSALSR